MPSVYQEALEMYRVPSCQKIAVFTHIVSTVLCVISVSCVSKGRVNDLPNELGIIRSQTSKFPTVVI